MLLIPVQRCRAQQQYMTCLLTVAIDISRSTLLMVITQPLSMETLWALLSQKFLQTQPLIADGLSRPAWVSRNALVDSALLQLLIVMVILDTLQVQLVVVV